MKRTLGRLAAFENQLLSIDKREITTTLREGHLIAICNATDRAEYDAERLALCWNACIGISNKVLLRMAGSDYYSIPLKYKASVNLRQDATL